MFFCFSVELFPSFAIDLEKACGIPKEGRQQPMDYADNGHLSHWLPGYRRHSTQFSQLAADVPFNKAGYIEEDSLP